MESFDESRFRRNVDAALKTARTVLENEKRPIYAADAHHVYQDKYELAELMTSAAAAATLNVLELLGLNARTLRKVRDWASTRSVSLALRATERCTFLRETKREEESSTRHEREYTGGFKITDKVITTITEWFWNFEADYELFLYCGNDPDDKVVLQSRHMTLEVMTTSKNSPRPEVVVRDELRLDVTWLLQQIQTDGVLQIHIDRDAKSTRTPRRNDVVEAAGGFLIRLRDWATSVHHYFSSDLFPVQKSHGLDLGLITAKTLLSPVLPLFLASRGNADTPYDGPVSALARPQGPNNSSVLFTTRDLNLLLDEQRRGISEKFAELARAFPDGRGVITVAEANLMVAALHSQHLTETYIDGVNYLEDLLRKQLIGAIGKVLTPVDFTNYMTFHNRKVFREAYQPRAFAYAVRRPDHYPEGILSLEGQLLDGTMPDAVQTIVSRADIRQPMRFGISASARVAFTGEVFLHGYVSHQFSGESGIRLSLNARARQFSSFLVLVGRITGPSLFDPQFGFVVQNKDEVNIPLETETIPTPKEFRDAIESLSPEQQQFAKLYRGMQLASTLFGVCVIQIKPQLERVLNLSNDSLTKEIRLTQTLMDLFLQYQIPSDLLSFLGASNASDAERLAQVKRNVAEIEDVIRKAKDKEKEEAAKEAQMRMLEQAQQLQPPRAPVNAPLSPPRMMSARASPRSSSLASAAPAMMSMSAAPPSMPMAAAAAPAPPSVPAPAPAQTSQPVEAAPSADASQTQKASTAYDSGADASAVDYTRIPTELDRRLEALDTDSAVRPTILNVGHVWTKSSQAGLLSAPVKRLVEKSGQKLEKNTCYDLLDALTKSGCLGVEGATLHVIIAATHCFEKNLMDTLVQDNVNPIEKLERSNLIVASVIHQKAPEQLLKEHEVQRVKDVSQNLFLEAPGQTANVQLGSKVATK